MDKWFTTDRIDQDTYIISEYRHWEETHCYLLNGTNRSLLIDTGLGISNIYEEVRRLTDNPVTAVATHVHWDHIGGHKYFPDFYVHSLEAEWLNGKFPLPVEAVRKMVFPFRPELCTCCAAAGEHDSGGSSDFTKQICASKLRVTGHAVDSNKMVTDCCDLPDGFDVNHYEIFQGTPAKVLGDRDVIPAENGPDSLHGYLIEMGGRTVEALHTPGHSPGHLCFWEKDRGYLFTGDLVYKGTLFAYYPSTDPAAYLDSLEKVAALPARRIFPAHHSLDIQPEIVIRMRDAFRELRTEGKLHHGSGTFDYGDWAVCL